MPPPPEMPVRILEGWPQPLLGSVVTAVEGGLGLGDLGLDEATYASLRDSTPILSLRIDDHPVEDGWQRLAPDRSVIEEHTFVIPLTPVSVPAAAFSSDRALSEWTGDTHGALGRLLLWNVPITWWILSHPDLEVTLVCSSAEALAGLFGEESLADIQQTPVADWIPTLTAQGRSEAAELAGRYGLRGHE